MNISGVSKVSTLGMQHHPTTNSQKKEPLQQALQQAFQKGRIPEAKYDVASGKLREIKANVRSAVKANNGAPLNSGQLKGFTDQVKQTFQEAGVPEGNQIAVNSNTSEVKEGGLGNSSKFFSIDEALRQFMEAMRSKSDTSSTYVTQRDTYSSGTSAIA